MRTARRFRRAGLGLLLAASCALPGCAGADDAGNQVASGNGTNTAGASATASAGPDMAKWTKCLRDNGVDVKDPEPGGAVTLPMDRPATRQALEKCKQYEGGERGSTGFDPNDPKQQEQRRKFAKCMREAGVDWPDPDPNQPGAAVPGLTPQMREAFEKCTKEIQGGSQ
jgi:hypothetical protein